MYIAVHNSNSLMALLVHQHLMTSRLAFITNKYKWFGHFMGA